jgi:phosphomannomutase/phosphoglucomutase
VSSSRWQFVYWGLDQSGRLSQHGERTIALVLAVAVILLALLLFITFRWLSKVIAGDQSILMTMLNDLQAGRRARRDNVKLLACRETMELIRDIAQTGIAGNAPKVVDQKADTKPDELIVPVVDPLVASIDPDGGMFGVQELNVDRSIFRTYDIRGIVETSLTPEVVYEAGRAIASAVLERDQKAVIVGRDGRLSGPELVDALSQGIRAGGCNVIDIGAVPTPLVYFTAHTTDSNSGVMVTGSHNPPEYNGLKIVIAGETLAEDGIQDLYRRIVEGDLQSGEGSYETADVISDYIEYVTKDIKVSGGKKVVLDCGNGIAGAVAPQLFRALGCEVTELFCDVDGNFPNHHPDPGKPENLTDLIQAVEEQQADIGLAFDGDGDRLGVVASDGTIIWPDRLLMLFAMDVLNRNSGAQIIYDVKCSRYVGQVVRDFGGKALMWKTGHSLIKAKMKETGALLAGEMSGHIFFKERWFGFDDALYSAARLLEILANDPRNSSAVFSALPDSVNTAEINVSMQEGEPKQFMERLLETAHFEDADVVTIDGVRADFADGWGLVRASNTTPSLVLRFEADNTEALDRIQAQFKQAMLAAQPDLSLPF